MIKHVWFDVGGTLYRETAAFDLKHDELRYAKYSEITGKSNPEKAKQEYANLYAQYGSNSGVFRALGKPSDFWQIAFDEMKLDDVISPDPVVAATLDTLSKQLPVSLFSNFKTVKIQEVLTLLGIKQNIFTHILSGDEVTERKPDPEGFRKMLELSGLPASEVMYVGDRIKVDILPAKVLGMSTCLVWQESKEADYSTTSFADIPAIVSNA